MNETQEKTVLSLLERQQYASVEELSAALAVSASTTRRILEGLQNRKLITRTHGGAKLNDANNAAPSFTFRIHQNLFEKKKIALSAIKLIKDGDIIFLDGSTTAYCIAEYLGEFRNIKVITNGIETLSLLSQNRIPAYSTGGEVSAENPAVLAGRLCRGRRTKLFCRHRVFFGAGAGYRGKNLRLFRERNLSATRHDTAFENEGVSLRRHQIRKNFPAPFVHAERRGLRGKQPAAARFYSGKQKPFAVRLKKLKNKNRETRDIAVARLIFIPIRFQVIFSPSTSS